MYSVYSVSCTTLCTEETAARRLFFDGDDCYRFYLLLQEGVERFGWDVATLSTALRRLSRKISSGSLSRPAREALEVIDIRL